MTPKAYMVFGSLLGVISSLGLVLLPETAPTTATLTFAAGALFGKGYGIWEERSRKKERARATQPSGKEKGDG